jgi:hypothetical protein
MLRECGASSTPRLLGSITDASGILVHPPSRVMTVWVANTLSRSRRRFARGLTLNFRLLKIRGRRECRAPDAPAALRARVRVARTQVITVTPETPGIPRAMVYGLFRALPGDRALLPPLSLRSLLLKNLTPASGCQDHTTLPSASSALVSRTISVHRIPPHVRDDRETPLLVRRGNFSLFLFLASRQVKF